MSQPFGRRAPPPAAVWGPAPAPAPLRPLPAAPPPATLDATPDFEPEFDDWQEARTGTRWRTWAMAGLIVLGGPLGFLMPDGIGQWAGFGLMGVGVAGFAAKFSRSVAGEAVEI
ncbi:MAG TPA: hypothetical protein VFW47_13255 [Phenylobacterium sp.]|nr:hypothetical protein [Phenylobacterium sp.]